MVNFDAGARTQFASILTALGICLASFLLTPYLYYLPKAMLAATIIVAVLSLVDISIFFRTWQHSKSDFTAMLLTVVMTLVYGVEAGVAAGMAASILLHLYNTSKPHIAEVGLVPNTQQFRNVKNYHVEVDPKVISLRIDESLLFSNVSYLEDYIQQRLAVSHGIEHVVLLADAINRVDFSALEMLENLNQSLAEVDIKLHFSGLKIPVSRRLARSGYFEKLSGNVYFSQYQAYSELSAVSNSE